MIWFRRIATIPLTIIFVVLLFAAILVTQVNDTLGSPGFFNDQMEQADIYNFIYDGILPAAIDEVEEDEGDDIPIDIAAIEDEVISAARKILPPEWLQEQVEVAVNAVIPYFVGATDRFTFTIVLRDRVDIASEVIKEDILHGDVSTDIYDDGVSHLADELYDNLDKLPYSLTLSKQQIEDSLRTVIAMDWATWQLESAIDSSVPYMTGEFNHFTVTIHPEDRVDPAAAAAKDIFSDQETYDYLLDEIIVPVVEENLESIVELPFQVSLSQEEIVSAVKVALPESWVAARLSEIVDGIAAYVKGEADVIQVTIQLADRKASAINDLTQLADQKLQNLFHILPQCSMEEFMQIVLSLPPNTLPQCRPSGGSYEEFKSVLNVDLGGAVDQRIGKEIPDQWFYTDDDLRQSLGEDNEDFLDELRDWVLDGWTFTDADLLDELDSKGEENLQDVRGWIESGYTVTETDLREAIADTEEDLSSFDDVRRWIATGRTWLWTLWLIPFLLLLCVGLLGGRNWTSRLAWALAVLLLTSLAFYIVTAVTYSRVAEPRIEEAIDISEYEGVEAVLAEKGKEMIENASSSFVSGMKGKMLWMMIGSGLVLLAVIGWGAAGQQRREEYVGRLKRATEYIRRKCSSLWRRLSRTFRS